MKLKSIILSLVAIALLASCSMTNDVVGGGIQKRKYNDGYYFASGKKFNRKADIQKAENILSENDVVVSQKTESETQELLSKNEEVIISPEIVSEPKIEEINDDKKIESDNNSISTTTETEIEETETVETGDKINGTYKSKKIATIIANSAAASDSVLMLILLVILCFIIPPLAVFIFEGVGTRFWIDLILFVIGLAVFGYFASGLAGLAMLVSVIFALLIVLSVI